MRGSAEAGETEALAVRKLCEPQRSPANRARTKQRCCFHIAQRVWHRIYECRGSDDVFGVAAIHIATSRAKTRTEVLAIGPAPLAFSIRPIDPRDSNAIAFAESRVLPNSFHSTDDLMSWNNRVLRGDNAAFRNVQISAAHRADRNPNQDVAIGRCWLGELGEF